MIFTVTLNPAADYTLTVPDFRAGEVNRATEVRFDPGGKGINVSKALQTMGMPTVAMGLLGGSAGDAIESALKEMGIQTDFVRIAGNTRTNTKVIDPEKGETTDLNTPGPDVTAEELETFKQKLKSVVHGGDTVVFSGSLPAGVPGDIYKELIRMCRSKAAKTILDTSGAALKAALDAKPYFIKPNADELRAVVEHDPEVAQEVVRAARVLSLETGAYVLASMGGEGAVMIQGRQALYAKAPEVVVHSTVGAGDAMVAALAAADANGMAVEDVLRFAVAAGSAAAAMPGSSCGDIGDVLNLAERVICAPVLG